MKYLLAPLLVGLFVSTQSCRQKPAGPPQLTRKYYQFAGESRCDSAANKGVSVKIAYALLSGNEPNAQRINDRLNELATASITDWLDSAVVAQNPAVRTDLAKAAALFADDYQSMQEDMGGIGGCWELKTTADTVYSSPNVLTMKALIFAYTGGAHPNTNQLLLTFDRNTGRELHLTDMVSDTAALVGIVENAFRKQQQLAPGDKLEEQGYFLRDGQFFLPGNIAPGRQGMIFYYNPYEIAAYAVGPIEIVVPYEKLNGLLRRAVM